MSRSATDILHEIRGLANAGRYAITMHGQQRMRERGARTRDVRNALVSARDCVEAEGECWKVVGPDLDGDDLRLIVALREGVVVVTVY